MLKKVTGLALDFIQMAGRSYLPSRFEWMTGEKKDQVVC